MSRRDVYPILFVLFLAIAGALLTGWLSGPVRPVEDGPPVDCASIGNGICHPRPPR